MHDGHICNEAGVWKYLAASFPPRSFAQAQKWTDWKLWSDAMDFEMSGILSQNVFVMEHMSTNVVQI
jgi:hypothetical protein